ncbi:Ubiquitin-like-specific protease 1 [Verticillium longisporum]|uniref:Ubiquitin-like-specific protease 1 n=1 Tax=Verticillium longisporum TaxID=100787 RepID=A0A8I2Z5E0_VERLO|nr:Ubiquitin-like-specific protease 1 [Verticillium longisporum]
MTQIIGKLSAVVSSLFGPVSHKSNTVEQRTTDHHTGNVALKKRRLSQRGDDEPSWIDEDARSRLWDRHIKCLHQGLSQATMCIKDQHAGDLDRRSAQRFSYRGDKFAHLKLENLVTLVMPITHASAVIEHLYSRDMLEQAKHYNKTPQARVQYGLERNGEDLSIDHATVCNDLYALLAKRPIPSLVVNVSPEILSLWEPILAIPGSFPEEDTSRVADPQPKSRNDEFAASRSAQPEMPLASRDSLPTFHDVIPFDLIQAHLVDPQSADTYSEKGSSDVYHSRSMRTILKEKLRSPPSYVTRLKSPNSMRVTATSSASLFTPASPSRQNTGHYFVSAGGKEAEDAVDVDQTAQIAEGSNTNFEGQVESDSADEKQEDREHDVLTRHGASINAHMQEGLRKYYRPSSPFSGSDLDKKLSAAAAKAAAEAEKKRADAEKLLKTGGLRPPHKPMVAPLSDDWLRKVEASITRQGASVARTFEGTELTPRDFARVVPPTEWLNDEIVNGTLLWLDRFINLAAGVSDARSANRKCLALSSFIWKRIQDAGPGSTGRALRRFGVSKANFGDLDTVLLPVCENSHWTLIVVRPKMRTIAHMDSLSVAGSASKLKRAQAWVKAVLEENFIEAEWRVVRHEAPRQTNGYDCGVHTITNGMCIALGFSKDFDLAGL